MSVSLVLLPMAIALMATVSSGVTVTSMIRDHIKEKKLTHQELPPMPTQFTDLSLLEKTLQEHGLKTRIISGDEMVCVTEKGSLSYRREQSGDAFYVTVSGLSDPGELLEELECLDKEYKQNVQSYTYEKLLAGLGANNMTLQSEEVLEDNSILLTIDV